VLRKTKIINFILSTIGRADIATNIPTALSGAVVRHLTDNPFMKKLFLIIGFQTCLTCISISQTVYLTNIKTKGEYRHHDSSINISINYWRFDTCLYLNRICKYNTSTAANIKVYQNNEYVKFLLLRSNNSGYKSKHKDDSLTYYFYSDKINSSYLIRKIWIEKGSSVKDDLYIFKNDTFKLTVIDTLVFKNQEQIRKVFGRDGAKKLKDLQIFVLKSVDANGSIMLHYWTENIGIIKLADEKCWRYSFEMKDNRTKPIEKLFERLMLVIKSKYNDPNWLSEPCYFE
jgi:hypothetical protein